MAGDDKEPLVEGGSSSASAQKASGQPTVMPEHSRRITSFQLAVLCYALTCGGPMGTEPVVAIGGPLLSLVMLTLGALLWATPVALVTAEITAALPHDGGFIVWSYVANGRFWAVQQAAWSWLSGVVINAVYPVLAYDATTHLLGEPPWMVGYITRLAAAAGLCMVNYMGLKAINRVLLTFTIFMLIPFVVLVFVGAPQIDWSVLPQAPFEPNRTIMPITEAFGENARTLDVNWASFVNSILWNMNGFPSTSVYAGEVADPGTTYPRALMTSIAIMLASYIFPLVVSAGVNKPPWYLWEDGSFSAIGAAIAGDWLGYWITTATIASAAAMFISELMSDTYQLVGMAELGLAPALLASRSRNDTPWVAILISFGIMSVLVAQEFMEIVAVSNIFALLSLMQIFASAAKLHARFPEIKQLSKMQLPDWFFTILIVLAVSITTFSLAVILLLDVSTRALFLAAFVLILAMLYYLLVMLFIPARVNQADLEAELIKSGGKDFISAHRRRTAAEQAAAIAAAAAPQTTGAAAEATRKSPTAAAAAARESDSFDGADEEAALLGGAGEDLVGEPTRARDE